MACVKTLGQQVQDFMAAEGLNSRAMAALVKTSRQNIENLVNGKAGMPRYIADLARVMRTSVEALVAGEPVARYALPPVAGVDVVPLAQRASPVAFTLPAQLTWETLMQSEELPSRFVVAVPDDALAPRLARGTLLVFERSDTAQPGQCVLAQDARGSRYIRRFAQGVGGTWEAQALNDAFVTLRSDRDGLQVLAVMAWRAESHI